MDIDFVIMWVDGADPSWLAEKRQYACDNGSDARAERYRDWGILQYWFRGVEKFAPWVRKIHFVTWGHLPAWLDTSNPKLHVVRHEDFIPEETLPLFNSSSIEMHLHRIEGLAEHFVFFNDDFFLTRPVSEEDFFRKGLPCDMLAFQPVVANPKNPVMTHLLMNDALLLCKHFDKRANVRMQPGKYFHLGYPMLYFFYNVLELAFPLFTGFYTVHGPSPYLKKSFEEVWEAEGDVLSVTTKERFRSVNDINQYVVREWQKLKGNFVPVNVQRYMKYFEVDDVNRELVDTIVHQKRKIVVINDTGKTKDVDAAIAQLQAAFIAIMPDKSAFEK